MVWWRYVLAYVYRYIGTKSCEDTAHSMTHDDARRRSTTLDDRKPTGPQASRTSGTWCLSGILRLDFL